MLNEIEYSCSLRRQVLEYAQNTFGTEAERLWARYPRYVVLRRQDNKKWYGVIMDVAREKLGIAGEGSVDILNIKCGPLMAGSLTGTPGVLPSYHMRGGGWVSLLLDGTVDFETVEMLLCISYDAVGSRRRQKAARVRNPVWLIPANPGYFDLEKAFGKSPIITWKQSSSVQVGDTVYIYVALPVASVMYKCRALQVDMPREYADKNLRVRRMMKLELVHRFPQGLADRQLLRSYGVNAVRGPRGVPNSLLRKLEELEGPELAERGEGQSGT